LPTTEPANSSSRMDRVKEVFFMVIFISF